MGTVLSFDSTGRLTNQNGKVARQVRVPLLSYLPAYSGAAWDHGHHHGFIHAAARQTEGVRAPRKAGVWQGTTSSHGLRARPMYAGEQRRRFDRI